MYNHCVAIWNLCSKPCVTEQIASCCLNKSYIESEGNISFKDVLNTFLFMAIWHQKYGKGQLIKRENPFLLLHRLLFLIRSGQCCSARLSRAQVHAFAGSSVQDRKRKREGRGGWTACTGRYIFQISIRDLLYAPRHRLDRKNLVIQHWLEWEIVQWVHYQGSIWWPITPWADSRPQVFKVSSGKL